MQAIQFEQSIGAILKRDRRFDPQAYYFLKEVLDFTIKRASAGADVRSQHVSGPELLDGFRDHALEQFGPMAVTLMKEWGVRKCSDVGDMVFNLIDEQIFGRQESDRKEDFIGSFDLEDALCAPFVPRGRAVKRASRGSARATGN